MSDLKLYRAKLKTRARIMKEIPRDQQGWWADVCAGETLYLRDATEADIDRCNLGPAAPRDPSEYLCENIERGSLVRRIAIAELTEIPARGLVAHHNESVRLNARIQELEAELSRRTQPEATAPAQELSAAILALPCKANMADLRGNSDTELRAYQEGHKDARLAASALVSGNSFREHLRRSSETVKNWPDWKTHRWAVMPSNALVAGDRVDALRWRAFTKALVTRIPGPGHGTKIKVVEVCPMYGEEKEVSNITTLIDRAIQAQKDGHG